MCAPAVSSSTVAVCLPLEVISELLMLFPSTVISIADKPQVPAVTSTFIVYFLPLLVYDIAPICGLVSSHLWTSSSAFAS